jgi:hypothetical protein
MGLLRQARLGGLSERDYAIVHSFDTKPYPTLQELAARYGITRERVRQILVANGVTVRGRPQLPFTKCEYRRLMNAVKRAAEIELRKEEHGTLRRYRGGRAAFGLPSCKCDLCLQANRDRTYNALGYKPKRTREEYQELVKQLGRFIPAGWTIEDALENKDLIDQVWDQYTEEKALLQQRRAEIIDALNPKENTDGSK